ncbi:MAG: hypothetical protein K6U14_04575 [Firmicutes bacterium]|nr:hypothetical protein [Alicyclobacillaceae bacterium]MCL6496897.1 hypothetical protein [Bacillota bacterium]
MSAFLWVIGGLGAIGLVAFLAIIPKGWAMERKVRQIDPADGRDAASNTTARD